MLYQQFGRKKVPEDYLQVKIIKYLGYKVNVKAVPIFHSIFFPIY